MGFASANTMNQNFSLLGLECTATEQDILSAYRKLSLLHHPDKGGKQEDFVALGAAKDACIKHLKNPQPVKPINNHQPWERQPDAQMWTEADAAARHEMFNNNAAECFAKMRQEDPAFFEFKRSKAHRMADKIHQYSRRADKLFSYKQKKREQQIAATAAAHAAHAAEVMRRAQYFTQMQADARQAGRWC